MADRRISVRLDEETKRRLDEEVAASGCKESELVRAALTAYFSNRPRPISCLELAQRHGLVGRGKNLPTDLSTNHAHFEGFGK